MKDPLQKWEYIFVRVPKNGATIVWKPKGDPVTVANEHIFVTLNNLGREGWELIQGHVTSDSNETAYLLKRPLSFD